eukprot:CAMPEP_0185019908 /NCGR_PEP_ID=MMETSP1103-20130426/2500_1 /TAXON_ID=36769 /ORGANISM="Paraphysomonas bandaiensis, Strain Caron Lab Isolate" /LENGTH=74 /DNA_ID=CAMNT_0027550473 /DNA_START=70 /DNA_END=294 /DNA_ORIENTATION=-
MSEQAGPENTVGGSSKYAKAFTVPPEFPESLRTLVREILRNQPQSALDIHKFALEHFTQQLNERAYAEAVGEDN